MTEKTGVKKVLWIDKKIGIFIGCYNSNCEEEKNQSAPILQFGLNSKCDKTIIGTKI